MRELENDTAKKECKAARNAPEVQPVPHVGKGRYRRASRPGSQNWGQKVRKAKSWRWSADLPTFGQHASDPPSSSRAAPVSGIVIWRELNLPLVNEGEAI